MVAALPDWINLFLSKVTPPTRGATCRRPSHPKIQSSEREIFFLMSEQQQQLLPGFCHNQNLAVLLLRPFLFQATDRPGCTLTGGETPVRIGAPLDGRHGPGGRSRDGDEVGGPTLPLRRVTGEVQSSWGWS